jgi:flagellar biosynthesis protein FliR
MPPSLLNHVGPFMLVLFRMSGLLIFAPLLSSSILPARMRALLCVSFTLAIYPTLVSGGVPVVDTDLFSLVPLAFAETLIGLAMGLMASLPMYAVQLGGLVMGQQAGMSLGQIYNPALDVETDTIGQFLQYAALVIFILMGGLEALFVALGHTFANVPIGRAIAAGGSLAPVELMTGLISSGFELALRVSAPVLCIILVETIASALIAKTVPQINVQSIGFSVKVVITLLVLATSASAVLHASGADISQTVNAVIRWTENLRPLAPS